MVSYPHFSVFSEIIKEGNISSDRKVLREDWCSVYLNFRKSPTECELPIGDRYQLGYIEDRTEYAGSYSAGTDAEV